MNTLLVVLPLPPRILHPNSRPHHMAKAKATKAYRAEAARTARLSKNDPPRWKSAHVHIVYFFKDARRRDRDNLLAWLKSAFDGLADSGVVENDADFVYHPILIAKDTKRPRVEIEITSTMKE